jgi:hypothetical protein
LTASTYSGLGQEVAGQNLYHVRSVCTNNARVTSSNHDVCATISYKVGAVGQGKRACKPSKINLPGSYGKAVNVSCASDFNVSRIRRGSRQVYVASAGYVDAKGVQEVRSTRNA